ncbi:MAG: hypothetical protein LUI06_08540 [Ruminococcus sp.]|nr:hypothetical protein [Ruminococcus sp.]
MKTIFRRILTASVTFVILLFMPLNLNGSCESTTKYYLGEVVNAGKDTGFSESNKIEEDDPHFGWELGTFYVSGYTSVTDTSSKSPVFLKNVGDTVQLNFCLDQDISKLNGDSALSIYSDKNGYDEYFGIEKTNFGKGTLIIQKTDYENKKSEPTVYTDYLKALEEGADTQVDVFEEGDYEVALNYEIRNDPRVVFGVSIIPTYTNYRISFKFSVRNGNCMVFPFDVETGGELTNTSITENGFYLDLANSRYLDINIKKEVLAEGANGLVEDTKFNKPASDGEQYTDEGIYTITVKNKYTNEKTTKVIYVGTNDILKAYVSTDYSISEINDYLEMGATINSDGSINVPSAQSDESDISSSDDESVTFSEESDVYEDQANKSSTSSLIPTIVAIVVVLALIVIIFIVCKFRKKDKRVERK